MKRILERSPTLPHIDSLFHFGTYPCSYSLILNGCWLAFATLPRYFCLARILQKYMQQHSGIHIGTQYTEWTLMNKAHIAKLWRELLFRLDQGPHAFEAEAELLEKLDLLEALLDEAQHSGHQFRQRFCTTVSSVPLSGSRPGDGARLHG
jgi:hypothetical protein